MIDGRWTWCGLIVFTLAAAACGGGRAAAPPLAAPPPSVTEARLWAALDTPLPAGEELAIVAELEAELGPDGLNRLLADAVENDEAPAYVRGNALMQLGERRAVAWWSALRKGAEVADPTVRVAAAVALQDLLAIREAAALGLLERLLADDDAWVAAKALEAVVDHDVELLRRHLAAGPLPELAPAVEELIRLAESRGAPLAADPATGVLARELAAGARIEFRPATRWQQWDAAVGEVVLIREGREPLVLATEVEAVANVLPVVLSPDEGMAAVESGRRILVVDLETGAQRPVGHGVAPRPLPFTDAFVFLRPLPTSDDTGGTAEPTLVTYDVVRAEFRGGEPTYLGSLTAATRMDVRGNYSPVRWMRVRHFGDAFLLMGDGVETFTLPDPFAPAGGR